MKKVSVLLGSLVVIANLGLLGSAVQAQSGKGPELVQARQRRAQHPVLWEAKKPRRGGVPTSRLAGL